MVDYVSGDSAGQRASAGAVLSPIRLFVTGGTFDKEYDEIHGTLDFRDTHLPEMLEMARSRLDVRVRTLMMIDSLEMSDADRALARYLAHRYPVDPPPAIA